MIQFSNFAAFLFILVNITFFMADEKMRYILMWTNDYIYTHNYKINMRAGQNGQELFIASQCRHTNCYLTDNKNLLGEGQVTKFDAVMFDGHSLGVNTKKADLPEKRSDTQKYIMMCAEQTCNYTGFHCNPILNRFFNMTASKSKTHYEIMLEHEELILREYATNITLCENQLPEDETLILRNKIKAVAWFMSNCTHIVRRNRKYVNDLKKALRKYSQTFDTYGCGNLECPKENNISKCDKIKDEYFFYLDFERWFENKTCPFAKNSVPITFYKSKYRYAPLGTYIDAVKYTPETLASEIVYLINTPKKYNNLFRFRNRSVTYYPANVRSFPCKICATLNNKRYMNKKHTCGYRGGMFADNATIVCNFYKAHTIKP